MIEAGNAHPNAAKTMYNILARGARDAIQPISVSESDGMDGKHGKGFAEADSYFGGISEGAFETVSKLASELRVYAVRNKKETYNAVEFGQEEVFYRGVGGVGGDSGREAEAEVQYPMYPPSLRGFVPLSDESSLLHIETQVPDAYASYASDSPPTPASSSVRKKTLVAGASAGEKQAAKAAQQQQQQQPSASSQSLAWLQQLCAQHLSARYVCHIKPTIYDIYLHLI
jgi:hypothetical protein